MMTATLTNTLDNLMVRGTEVGIANSYSKNPELRGIVTTVRSNGMVTCNGKGHCAGDGSRCIGKAVFVIDPTVEPADPEVRTGWRYGAFQVCLTHILVNGQSVLSGGSPATVQVPEPVQTPATLPVVVTAIPVVEAVAEENLESEPVSWVSLAETYATGDLDNMTRKARSLMTENDLLRRQVIALQEQVIDLISVSL